VYDTQEVRDALAALRAIDDPTDHLSLVAALRPPLYACSDVDLYEFRRLGGTWQLQHEPPDTVPADHPVRRAFAHLRSLWHERWWLRPSEMLERLLRERHAFVLGFGDPRPAEVWRRLRFLLDQARSFEAASQGSLRGFVEWAELQSAEGARVHEPLLPETDDDAVRIMTIHGAKGLEFPITILSGMTTLAAPRRGGVSVIWGDDGPPDVRLRKGIATANHEPRADLESEMDTHEKLRLLYVAATRARDHLVVSCHHGARGGSATATYGGQVWSFFTEHPDLWRPMPKPPPVALELPFEPVQVPLAADDRDSWIEAREVLLAPQRRRRVVSATGVARQAHAAATPLVDQDDDGADLADDAAVPARRQGRAGSAIGRAAHATLQVLELSDPRGIDEQVRRQCDLEAIPDKVGIVAALVRSALASPAVQLAAKHPHHKELFVAAPVGDRVVEGYVDLLVETPTGLIVVDYKTDSASSPAEIDARLEAYELQGATYAAALQVVTGSQVAEVRFVFCKPGGAIERTVRDLPGAIARVHATLAQ
jgi:ATP-dependent exoDNAse (exonuclease V) beta subunit